VTIEMTRKPDSYDCTVHLLKYMWGARGRTHINSLSIC